MAQLIVRRLDEEIVEALKVRAAANGRSAEAEHREILRAVLLADRAGSTFKELLLAMPDVGEDADFEAPRDLPREVSL